MFLPILDNNFVENVFHKSKYLHFITCVTSSNVNFLDSGFIYFHTTIAELKWLFMGFKSMVHKKQILALVQILQQKIVTKK